MKQIDSTGGERMPAGRIVAGMDIGNSTTEVLLLERNGEDVRYVAGAMTPTTEIGRAHV